MKKMLLIGGIISMVLPAMADTDLSDYHLLNSDDSATCLGPDGYTGFESGDVTMSALYVKNCTAGQYYNATSATPVSNHPVWDGTECKNPVTDETVSGISSAEACAAAVLDYYYIDACANVGNAQYKPQQDPVVTNGVLQATAPQECSTTGYSDGSDGTKGAATDCYRFCGTGDDHLTVSQSTLNTLNATSAQYTSDREHYQGSDACTVSIAADGCKSGYTYVNLAGSANSQFYKCDIGEAANCAESNVPDGSIEPGHWVVVNVSGLKVYGSMAFESGTCAATVTHVQLGNGNKTAYTFGPINVGTGTSATDCFSIEAQMALGQGIAAHYTNGIATNYTFCMPNVVNITWNGVANPGDAATCVYGGDLGFPEQPTPPAGYSFIGWTVGEVETTVEP